MTPYSHMRRVGIVASLATLAAIAAIAVETVWLGPPPLPPDRARSITIVDRNDALLRAYTTADGKWRLPLAPDAVDPLYLKLLFAFEDRRFHTHSGVDPISYVRIALELARHRRLVSGGSTLTMQVARLLDDTFEKSARGKLRQIIRAVQLESRFSKTEILAFYLERAPFGGNIEGVRAASFAYFGKEPRRLSPAEAALLVAIPQSPNARRPDKHTHRARAARDKVLRLAHKHGVISKDDLARALAEPVPSERRSPPQLASHLADAELQAFPERLVHRTTIDARMQGNLETLARDHAKLLGAGLSAALVVVDHMSGEVRAEIGSAGYLDETRQGAVNMVRAVRSPGSTLKPLIYGLAFDSGLAHPETLIEDRPTRFGTYTPKNFDHDWHGTVTIREALAKSLNIPAVKVLDALGPAKVYGRLTALGIDPKLPQHAEPSLAMALGGVGMTARELAILYTTLARGGVAIPVKHRRDDVSAKATESARLISDVASYYVGDILKNAPPPANARGGQIAYKTGTSYGYRDAWSAGFDGRHVIVAWVGRADGAPVPGLNGRAFAAPLLFDAFHRIAEQRTPLRPAPLGVIRGKADELPPTLKRFREQRDGDLVAGVRETPVSIAFPPDRAEIEAEPSDGESIILKAEGGKLPLAWFVDGEPLLSDPSRREVALAGKERGFLKVSVVDASGRTDRVTVRLK